MEGACSDGCFMSINGNVMLMEDVLQVVGYWTGNIGLLMCLFFIVGCKFCWLYEGVKY